MRASPRDVHQPSGAHWHSRRPAVQQERRMIFVPSPVSLLGTRRVTRCVQSHIAIVAYGQEELPGNGPPTRVLTRSDDGRRLTSGRCCRYRSGLRRELVCRGGGLMIGIRLFGPTAVEIDGELLPGVAVGRRPRQILEILALSAGMPVGKDRLADLLWEGNPPASYPGTLESYVCLLRRGLGLGSGRQSLLSTTTNGYVLARDGVDVDLVTFRRLVATDGAASAAETVDRTVKAMLLVTGELLASEPYAAWAIEAREVARREVVAACVNAAQLANGIGDGRRAIGLAHFAIAHDRLCEE